MASVLDAVLVAVKSQIEDLALTGIVDASIYIQKVPTTRDFTSSDFPAVIISPIGSPKLNTQGGTNLRDEIEYPIGIFIVDNDNQNQTSDRDQYFLWNERITKSFRTPRLTGVTSIVNSFVSPGVSVHPDWIKTGQYQSGLTVSFISWESRT